MKKKGDFLGHIEKKVYLSAQITNSLKRWKVTNI